MNRIAELRKTYGYSQAQLAELLGVHQTAVSQWEKGKTLPDILTAHKLSHIFGIAIEDMLNDVITAPVQTISKIRVSCAQLSEEGLQKVFAYTEDLIATGKYKRPVVLPNTGEGINGNG